jgi:DtxR family Mn-dependent transcriptional regulator
MIHPFYALLIAVFFLIGTFFVFSPGKGLLGRIQRYKRIQDHICREDILKHLYENERQDKKSSLHSMAGALNISTERTADLIQELQHTGLIQLQNDHYILSAEGRDYALKMIRIHRLYELYLSEQTGVPEAAWHTHAEIAEHEITPEQAEAISDQLGNPRYDPHGDPIPSADGFLPPNRGLWLTDWPENEIGRIIQIEDEPVNVYNIIREKDIQLGIQIEQVRREQEYLKLIANGRKVTLPLIAAGNIRAEVLKQAAPITDPPARLRDLQSGEQGVVIALSQNLRGSERRRLMDLGVTPGTIIRNELVSAFGDPVAYNIRGAAIALRHTQANLIYVKKLGAEYEAAS